MRIARRGEMARRKSRFAAAPIQASTPAPQNPAPQNPAPSESHIASERPFLVDTVNGIPAPESEQPNGDVLGAPSRQLVNEKPRKPQSNTSTPHERLQLDSSHPDPASNAVAKPASFSFAPRRRVRVGHKRRLPVLSGDNHLKAPPVGGFEGRPLEDVDSDSESSPARKGDPNPRPVKPAKRQRSRQILPEIAADEKGRSVLPSHDVPDAREATEAEDVDPLDAFMDTISVPQPSLQTNKSVGHGRRLLDGDEDEDDGREIGEGGAFTVFDGDSYLDRNKRKRPVYQRVDHSTVEYPTFQKDLYREVPELARMTVDDVRAARRRLGSVRIRGKRCPKPVHSFGQCGLSSAVLNVIQRANYESPTPIQAQAIPCIMSGRDVIGVAKTGSGKTLAFVLPVLRHVALQERPSAGEGPIALLIGPTRELAIQIYNETRRFARATGLRCVCAYGGTGVKDQISDLKRGADIVVCTPGRMIDMLAMNSGRVTNLRRVTIVVLDEADRMFDMGFEPQLTRLVENVRPDRQTVMFSATFPAQVERLARKVLTQPVEIIIGGNSVAATSISQYIEVRSEDSKFFRLLKLLGVWYERGSTLVFVDRQDNADKIFRELSQAGYLCMSLHGGMDQADRDSALADFKNGDIRVLVATSVAARGLDVKHLTLVVNYDVPNHYEDYVHRVGRTGRAGRSGTAYTFITPEQDMFAPDMIKALELSARSSVDREGLTKEDAQKLADDAARNAVSDELRQLAASFKEKQDEQRKAGIIVHGSNSGYGGRGFTFDEDEENAKNVLRRSQAKRFRSETEGGGPDDGPSDSDDGREDVDDAEIKVVQRSKTAVTTVGGTASASAGALGGGQSEGVNAGVRTAGEAAKRKVDAEAMIAEAEDKARKEAAAENLDDAGKAARLVLARVAVRAKIARQQQQAQLVPNDAPSNNSITGGSTALSAAAAAAAALSQKITSGKGDSAPGSGVIDGASKPAGGNGSLEEDETSFEAELEINDYPQHARWRVTHANALEDVAENTGCVATTRGNYYPAGRNAPAGERKLHLLIEGPDERSVKLAWKEIKRKLEEAASARPDDRGVSYSKYSVL